MRWLKTIEKHKKPLIIAAVMVATAGVILFAVHSMQAPAVGSVSQKPPAQQVYDDPYKDPGDYSGKVVRFTYPAHYKKTPSKITGNYLEVDNFVSTDHTNKYITVGVRRENLSDDSGINFRRKQPGAYKELPRTSNSVSFSSDANGSERTSFVQLSGYVVSISLTSPSGTDLTDDSQIVVSSLRLK